MDDWNLHSYPDQADLLRSARARDLQAISLTDLRNLAADLTTACEAARVAAIRNIMQVKPDPAPDKSDQRQCGFTSLYTALRRVRAEIKRKEARSSRHMTSGRGEVLPGSRLKARAQAQGSTS